ncbi:MAG: hypothetical protein ACRD2W_03080 [Acidimicrobiales bacterium]
MRQAIDADDAITEIVDADDDVEHSKPDPNVFAAALEQARRLRSRRRHRHRRRQVGRRSGRAQPAFAPSPSSPAASRPTP